jgi:hypothetical protein
MLMWDSMRKLVRADKKRGLVFASVSNWGHRPEIIACVASKFSKEVENFQSNAYSGTALTTEKDGRMNARSYYEKLGSAYFGLAPSGLGSDTFR